jgi:hypothetical protein
LWQPGSGVGEPLGVGEPVGVGSGVAEPFGPGEPLGPGGSLGLAAGPVGLGAGSPLGPGGSLGLGAGPVGLGAGSPVGVGGTGVGSGIMCSVTRPVEAEGGAGAGTGGPATDERSGARAAAGDAVGPAGGTTAAGEPVRELDGGSGTTTTGSRVTPPSSGVPASPRSPSEAAPMVITTSVGTEASATSSPTISAYRRVGPATP